MAWPQIVSVVIEGVAILLMLGVGFRLASPRYKDRVGTFVARSGWIGLLACARYLAIAPNVTEQMFALTAAAVLILQSVAALRTDLTTAVG